MWHRVALRNNNQMPDSARPRHSIVASLSSDAAGYYMDTGIGWSF
jgi:hypothetical protein